MYEQTRNASKRSKEASSTLRQLHHVIRNHLVVSQAAKEASEFVRDRVGVRQNHAVLIIVMMVDEHDIHEHVQFFLLVLFQQVANLFVTNLPEPYEICQLEEQTIGAHLVEPQRVIVLKHHIELGLVLLFHNLLIALLQSVPS